MKSLVYVEARGSLVFAPPAVALRVAQIHRAMKARTWGELKALLPDGELEKFNLEDFCEYDDDDNPIYPSDDAEEPTELVPGFSEGDYPPWLQTEQDRYLPREVLRRFAKGDSSVQNGQFWTIDPKHEAEIVAELRDRGYQVERRDDLLFW